MSQQAGPGLPTSNHLSDRPSDDTSLGQVGPETWGSWSGRRHYSLEVTQAPQRARQCGFGFKDRRPLAPAAVAKMVVRNQDNSIVDVDDIDSSFFLVTVDLWSADGKQETNLVLHPSSADQYPPPGSSGRRRTTSHSSRQTGSQTPVGTSTPTPTSYHPPEPSPNNSQASFYPSQPPLQDGPNNYPQNSQTQYRNASSDHQTPSWGYPPPAPVDRARYASTTLPSIQSFNRNGSSSNPESWSPESESYLDPALRNISSTRPNSNPENRENSTWNQSTGDGYPNTASDNSSTNPLPRGATYTRTLVGPLSANACRLLDEHRKPGIFFLFQDLSVRTEGTFRLRMRLMNVGAPPAPEAGAVRVHNDVSPILAQTFTDPFTVYSAKRFPGVPDTTALSIAFGNQGQKLPLRNRHGTGTSKRRRRDDSESDEDSDDA